MLHLTALLIERTVPGVRKTVKWNSAFYGVKGGDWFLGMHCFTNYVEAAFFHGTSLRPVPPGALTSLGGVVASSPISAHGQPPTRRPRSTTSTLSLSLAARTGARPPASWTQMTTWSKSCAMPGHAGTAPLAKKDAEGHT